MAIGAMKQLWQTMREVNLGEIKAGAERRFALVIAGDPVLCARLADALSQTPGRSGRHPWIHVVDAAGAPAALASAAPEMRLLLVLGSNLEPDAPLAQLQRRQEEAGLPSVTVIMGARLDRQVGAELPRQGERARALLSADPSAAELTERLAPAILRATESAPVLRLSLARQLPALRRPLVEDLIESVSRANATYALSTGVGEAVPGLGLALGLADVFVLTKNQLILAFRISLASGREGSARELMAEVAGVLGGGLIFRQIARELVGLVPVIGILPKVAVSYAGTKLIGHSVQIWADEGRRLELSELRGLYAEALEGGRALVEQLPGFDRLPLPGR